MTDFHQEGTVSTIHELYRTFDMQEYLKVLEERLEDYAAHTKISLLLPCLYTELENREVIKRIVDTIEKVRYISNVVVALGGTQEEGQFQEAKEYFARLSSPNRNVKLVWIDGAGIQEIFKMIEDKDISIGVRGKGQSVWITLGYLFARDDSFVDMMLHTYYDNALKFIKCYSVDAEMNNLNYDRYEYELTARNFRGYLWTAWENSRGPREAPLIPSWNRVVYSIPDIYRNILEAVEKDNK